MSAVVSLLVGACLFGLVSWAGIAEVRRLFPQFRHATKLWIPSGLAIGLLVIRPIFRALGWFEVDSAAKFVVGLIVAPTLFGVAGLLAARAVHWLLKLTRPAPSDLPNPDRRSMLLRATAVFPAAGVMSGVGGSALAQLAPRSPRIPMVYPDLPAALDGFEIVQISDLHLGAFVNLSDLEEMIKDVSENPPDLLVLTGDFADDLTRLDDALALCRQLPARHGVVASVGNHEYYRGIKTFRRAFDTNQIPFLINASMTIDVDGAQLCIGGADDPRFLGATRLDFLERTVAKTIDGAPSDAFRLLLSHRPEGFVAAQKHGFNLTLSGHTHGGQFGIGRRSIFEPIVPEKYLWGPYESKGARLYTSSGAGHWFPMRIGCPRELPRIVLRRAVPPTDQQT